MNTIQSKTTIPSLRSNVSESEALRSFSAGNLSSIVWRLHKGDFQRIAHAYLPFCLYRISYELNRQPHTRYFALDQVQGILDLFEFPHSPDAGELTFLETRNQLPALLSSEKSESLLREKVLRLIFQQG